MAAQTPPPINAHFRPGATLRLPFTTSIDRIDVEGIRMMASVPRVTMVSESAVRERRVPTSTSPTPVAIVALTVVPGWTVPDCAASGVPPASRERRTSAAGPRCRI